MAQQQFDDSWYLDLGSGDAMSQMYAPKAGESAWLTGATLVDPASAAAGKMVEVAVRVKNGNDVTFLLSAERPVATLRSPVLLDDYFWLEREDDDTPDAVVRFRGRSIKTPETEAVASEDDDGEAVASEDDEDEEIVEYELAVPEDSDDGEDDDGGEEEGEEEQQQERDGEFDVSVTEIADLLQMVKPSNFVPEARFLRDSALRVTAAGNTAGFMRVTAAEPDTDIQEGGDKCETQILVLYRYNCFSAESIGDGVEACRVEQRVQLRFIAAAGHGPRSLAWVGASLAKLMYPVHSSYLLRELWSGLITDVNIPVHATRVKVFVDAGILRPADCTPERIGNMISALEVKMAEPWYGQFHMELHLPEPVRCVTEDEADDHDTDYEERPMKRRRVAARENCAVCLELLEGDDLAAWPGCGKPHVFHATCLELVLVKHSTCPICRRSLYIEPKV